MYFANEPRWKTNRWPSTGFCMLNPTFKLKIFIIKMKIRNNASYLSCAALFIMRHRYQVQTFHKIAVVCVSKFLYIISRGKGEKSKNKKQFMEIKERGKWKYCVQTHAIQERYLAPSGFFPLQTEWPASILRKGRERKVTFFTAFQPVRSVELSLFIAWMKWGSLILRTGI